MYTSHNTLSSKWKNAESIKFPMFQYLTAGTIIMNDEDKESRTLLDRKLRMQWLMTSVSEEVVLDKLSDQIEGC